jgi:hypothetical protein
MVTDLPPEAQAMLEENARCMAAYSGRPYEECLEKQVRVLEALTSSVRVEVWMKPRDEGSCRHYHL